MVPRDVVIRNKRLRANSCGLRGEKKKEGATYSTPV